MGRLPRLRAAAQALHRPSGLRHPADVVRSAGPIQAQEPRAAKLAFRARADGLTAADVDRARTEERSLLRAWVMRKTVHLIPSEDAGWMVPLFADLIVPWSRRRLVHFGFPAEDRERGLQLMRRAVERDGPLTRPELVERLVSAGLPADTQAKHHLWTLATLEGGLCLGPDRGGLTCLVTVRDWLGETRPLPRDEALAELARRYMRAYAPATDRDLARWAGLPLRDARAGVQAIARELTEIRVGGETLLRPRKASRPPTRRFARLLGAFDNYNLAYESRDFYLPAAHAKQVIPGGGIIRPAIVLDGQIVGTWSSRRSGRRLTVELEPFADFDPEAGELVAAEVEDLGRFEGLTVA
ncbi:MAG TPA: winged helix DNA-binding domain-containing protein [Solirubrobacterales bacterium]|nr:winged helix DNA-binding domain-containing protein [Solirubrobacterales bacterium]